MTLTDKLLTIAERYCTATGRSRARVATLIFNDGKKLDFIGSGADLTTRSYERAMRWFSEQWPEGAEWPEGIDRPAPAEVQP